MATSGNVDVVATWTSSGKIGDTLRFRWWQIGDQNIAENHTTIGWALELIAGGAGYINSSAPKTWSVTIDGQTFSGSNTVGIGNNTSKTLASGTKIINHSGDGSKSFGVSFSQVFSINFNGWVGTVSGSGSWTLGTIPRATTPVISPATATMGNSIAISLPRAVSGFTHALYHDFKVGSWTQFAADAGTSASLVIPADWAARIPNASSAAGRIRCLTYNGSNLIGEKIVGFTAVVPESVVPIIDKVTVSEATSGIAEKFGSLVRNKSQLHVISNGSGAQGSKIASYKVEVLGISYVGEDITTYVITQAGTIDVKVTVTDSRGRQASKTVQVTLIEYFLPTITNFNAFRVGANGEEENGSKALKCVFDFTIASCNKKNDKSYKIEYKRDTDTNWTTLTSGSAYAANSSYTKENVLGLEYSYNIRLTVTDYFNSATYEMKVGSEIVPLCVYPTGKGLGVGGYPDKEALQVYFSSEFYKTLKLMNVDGNGTNIDLWNILKSINSNLTQLNNALTDKISLMTEKHITVGIYTYDCFILESKVGKYALICGRASLSSLYGEILAPLHYGNITNLTLTPPDIDDINVHNIYDLSFTPTECNGIWTINNVNGISTGTLNGICYGVAKSVSFYITSPPRDGILTWKCFCSLK